MQKFPSYKLNSFTYVYISAQKRELKMVKKSCPHYILGGREYLYIKKMINSRKQIHTIGRLGRKNKPM